MLFCINNKKKCGDHAGSKAPADIYQISAEIGCKEIKFIEPRNVNSLILTRIYAIPIGVKNWIRLDKAVHNEDWIILQHPYENIIIANHYIDFIKKRKNIHFVALIHDLNSLRKLLGEKEDKLKKRNCIADNVLLKKCDFIICHNEVMKNYMIKEGFDKSKIFCLKIFDYLHSKNLPEIRRKEKSVVIAGNLLRRKCEYLYKLCEYKILPFHIHLFGPNYERTSNTSFVTYHGQCSPDELPGKLEGSFGLVWDGTEIEKCAGNAGEYIRYNNPHKCSLFLSSNMPVIIWKQAALAHFVEDNGVGITVDSLMDIGYVIDKLTDEEYAKMVENTKKIGEKLRSGYFFKQALKRAGVIFD